MSSTHKTPLGLNKWVESDKPNMADFNSDNQIVDALLANKVNGRWTFIDNLSSLGITLGSETIADIVSAMPERTELYYPISNSANWTEYPTGTISTALVHIVKYNNSRIVLDFTPVDSLPRPQNNRKFFGNAYITSATGDVAWSDWKEIGAAEIPPIYDLLLSSGLEAVWPCLYWKNSSNEVTVVFEIYKPSGPFVENEYIATLPAGFRPHTTIPAMIGSSGASRMAGALYVENGGRLRVRPNADAAARYVFGQITFVAV